jgi:hypothetical protein
MCYSRLVNIALNSFVHSWLLSVNCVCVYDDLRVIASSHFLFIFICLADRLLWEKCFEAHFKHLYSLLVSLLNFYRALAPREETLPDSVELINDSLCHYRLLIHLFLLFIRRRVS